MIHHTGKFVSLAKKSPSLEQEVATLRAKNKVLETALLSIKNCATEHFDKKHDLVWFAKNRCRFPNHEKSKRLETSEDHREDITKLRGKFSDYYHGMNCGVLATSRLFIEITDVTHILGTNDEKLIAAHEDMIQTHHAKVKNAKDSFPNLNVD